VKKTEVITNFDKIVCKQEILGGKPCIQGTRISVDMILEWIASGATIQNICDDYKHLTQNSVVQAILYAAYLIQQERFFEVKRIA
jgi:uncharacterized protein (DUF433 family)